MKRILFPCLLTLIIACQNQAPQEEETSTNISANNFENYNSLFVEGLWKLNPIWASYEGYYLYDYMLPIPNEANKKEHLAFAERQLKKLQAFDLEQLSDEEKIDYYLIRDYLQSQDFFLNQFKEEEWNPASYNLGGAFFQVLNYREKDLNKRLEALSKKLEKVPAYYQQAQKNINQPTQVHTKLAIQQLKGSTSIFDENLIDSLEKSSQNEVFKADFTAKVMEAVKAIKGYVSFLENLQPSLTEETARCFRIGKEQFEKKFDYQIQSGYSAQEIFEAAVEEKSELHDQMFRLSDMLWEKYFGTTEKPGSRFAQIQKVIDAVSKKHVHRDSFITAIRQQIPELEAFVRENDLLTLDPEKPLVVRETPKYMRGFAGASISAPGPYDKNAETYYNVTPLDHYTEEEAESYLREYNHFVLQILNIHEAIPGHYTQLVYSNQSPSLIKSILGNGAMVEGWAVYTERMMLEAGYGGEALEMGLMYYKWNLRTVCNTILDYGIHVNNFTEEDAMQLLMKEAFQEKSEAVGKWRRARLSQVQLCSYFTGFYEIMQLRDELKLKMGDNFDLKKFHEKFLSYGSAPVKYIRKLMLEELKQAEPKPS
ncbi:MAG: DUF885 domain-containing protein [Vicingaceae bacterium]